jgi:ubiquinone/menaquinone biosynthesis C-methylase UbiE
MSDIPVTLDNAYNLKDIEQTKTLYRQWAKDYDESFGAQMGYVAPARVAEAFKNEADGNTTPVLDVGAGTGLLAQHLCDHIIDALDVSAEMLAVARSKQLYRRLIPADLTQPLPVEDGLYGAVVSSGTFTHGHVGPECLPELLRVTCSGALFTCGIAMHVFDDMGFGSTLARLQATNKIGPLRFVEMPLYSGSEHERSRDMGLVVLFRKQ